MLASDTAGTPLGKRVACSFWFVPAEMSVTVPLIVRYVPTVVATSGAVTVN